LELSANELQPLSH